MSDTPATPAASTVPQTTTADRIAKVIARSGVASRRDAEKMILEGRVTVNGKKITSPALDVLPTDKVVVDGKPIDAPQETRVWVYYKPLGLVTTEKDEQGRRTIFDEMPEGMPRVLNVGRLDLNSEGLLLLTNDGGLKRRLELPETGWLRKYRVRVNGRPMDDAFRPLREGIVIDGEEFLPMEITLDRQQGANAWLTVGLREGKNREIRRAMTEIGLTVNRLIRVSYGPFRLNEMQPGDVIEIKRKVLREQLGDRLLLGVEEGRKSRSEREEAAKAARDARFSRSDERGGERGGERGPRKFGDRPERAEGGEKRGFGKQRDFGKAEGGERPERKFGDRPERKFGAKSEGFGARKPRSEGFRSHSDEERKPRGDKPFGERKFGDKPRGERSFGDKPRSDKTWGDKPRGERSFGDKPRSDKTWGDKPRGERSFGDKPRSDKPWGDKPRGERSFGDKPRSDKPWGDKPRGERSFGDKPGFKSSGFKSHGGAGKPRAAGFKSHGGAPGGAPRGPKGPRGPSRG
ncbi:pseudouridine synthase [Rhodobacter xanthinilyticus]|nr:pseudouridine synthase [Rhodobacter xanthinilyticus]